MSILDDDVSDFFDTDDFAEMATINNLEVAVIFDKREIITQDIIAEKPVIDLPTKHTVGIEENDDVVVSGKKYTVNHWVHDGFGVTTIILDETK